MWWLLFRDCSYYSITLVTLALFPVGGKGETAVVEALIQFVLYFGYARPAQHFTGRPRRVGGGASSEGRGEGG